jgi:hypothetical protein
MEPPFPWPPPPPLGIKPPPRPKSEFLEAVERLEIYGGLREPPEPRRGALVRAWEDVLDAVGLNVFEPPLPGYTTHPCQWIWSVHGYELPLDAARALRELGASLPERRDMEEARRSIDMERARLLQAERAAVPARETGESLQDLIATCQQGMPEKPKENDHE